MPHFFFAALHRGFALQHRELDHQRQDEDRHVDHANAGVNPVPRQRARQQNARDNREDGAGHAKERVGKQQTGTALATIVQMGNQEGADRHGDSADHAEHEHAQREHREVMAGHQPGHGEDHQHKAKDQLALEWHNNHQPRSGTPPPEYRR